MAKVISEVMTRDPATLPSDATALDAARVMREQDIGDVIVLQDGTVCGIVTDRDIVVRGLAASGDPATRLGDICSRDVATLTPDSSIREAVEMMERMAIRRLPVIEDGTPVGVVSIGDLAMERDPDSALGQISSAPPNN